MYIKLFKSYAENFFKNPTVTNKGEKFFHESFDQDRGRSIPHICETVNNFIQQKISINEFKEKSERLCRDYPLWGFKGFAGQMQLNMYVNNIENPQKTEMLIQCITVPNDIDEAKKKIDLISEFIRIEKEKGGNSKRFPSPRLIFLLTYFWEIQAPGRFPVEYFSLRKVIEDMGVDLSTSNNFGESYAKYVVLIDEFVNILKRDFHKEYTNMYWLTEHILWKHFKEGDFVKVEKKTSQKLLPVEINQYEGQWIPPIIKDLYDLSQNQQTEWSKQNNLSPSQAFETKLKYIFTLLRFDTEELGQGTGKEPDGIATSYGVPDGDYAIIYDAKSRSDIFSIGTSDRAIKEYIRKKASELRNKHIYKTYFLIVTSQFEDTIKNVLKEIHLEVNVPVSIINAKDLLYLVELCLKNRELDHASLNRLFISGEPITRDYITEQLAI